MFKQVKKGKMLEMESSKPTACGGTVNEKCSICKEHPEALERYSQSYDENKEYWGDPMM